MTTNAQFFIEFDKMLNAHGTVTIDEYRELTKKHLTAHVEEKEYVMLDIIRYKVWLWHKIKMVDDMYGKGYIKHEDIVRMVRDSVLYEEHLLPNVSKYPEIAHLLDI